MATGMDGWFSSGLGVCFASSRPTYEGSHRLSPKEETPSIEGVFLLLGEKDSNPH